MSAPEQSPRPTPAQLMAQVATAALTRPAAAPEHSIDLTWNAKGDVQIALTTRGTDLDALRADAVATFNWLREQYPRGNGAA